MDYGKEFQKYATMHRGISSLNMDRYAKRINQAMKPMGYISPTVIEERQLNVTSMDIFSRLAMDRIVFLGTGIDDMVANIIVGQLLFLDSVDPKKDIQIYCNSGGGIVQSGFSIIDVARYISADVATINVGLCASMAAVILASAATPGKRSALKHSRTMIHQPSGGFSGVSDDLAIGLQEIMKLKKELYIMLSESTGKSYEEIEKSSQRDCWMTSQESLQFGLIDEILEKK